MAKKSGSGKRLATSGTFIQRSRSIGSAEKAEFHQIDGAGKSHVVRRFFDLSEADVSAITERLNVALEFTLQHAS
jgi:hypothetical protein